MKNLFKNYSKYSSRKKKNIVFLLIIILIAIWICTSRYIAQRTIFDYIDRQGISRNDIVVEDFFRDWTRGGYIYNVSIKDENPGIYYIYYYDKGKIMFSASEMNAQKIKEKIWGGNYLDDSEEQNLKYPPLKE